MGAAPEEAAPLSAPPATSGIFFKSGKVKMQKGLSQWQLPLPTITDRSGKQYQERIKNRSIPVIDAALSPLVATDAVLCTDGAADYARITRKTTLDHHVLSHKPGKRVTQKAFHIQNVNALHSPYNDSMGPFKGPASKRPGRYLHWFLLRSKMDGGGVFRRGFSPQ